MPPPSRPDTTQQKRLPSLSGGNLFCICCSCIVFLISGAICNGRQHHPGSEATKPSLFQREGLGGNVSIIFICQGNLTFHCFVFSLLRHRRWLCKKRKSTSKPMLGKVDFSFANWLPSGNQKAVTIYCIGSKKFLIPAGGSSHAGPRQGAWSLPSARAESPTRCRQSRRRAANPPGCCAKCRCGC